MDDHGLPEHITLLRETVRRFVESEMPREAARRWDRDDHFPRDVLDRLADLGLLGTTVDERYGGAGSDILATMVTIEELARRSLAVTSPYIMATCYAGMNLGACASEEQRTKLLPMVVAGKMLFSYGFSEPDVGADVASVKTTATRVGDTVVVNGAKRFCSGADFADYIYCLVNTDPGGARYRNLSLVLVPPRLPGVTIEPQQAMGLKGTKTCDVTFDHVEVPAWNIVGGEEGWNTGWSKVAGPGLDVEKIEVAAMALGIASAAVDDAWEYAQNRVQFGKPICTIQSIRHMLADARTDLLACRLMTYHAAQLLAEGRPASAETSMAKLFVTEGASRIVLSCQKVMGAYGYVAELDMERYVRDVLAMPILGGSSAIQRNNISNLLKLPRS